MWRTHCQAVDCRPWRGCRLRPRRWSWLNILGSDLAFCEKVEHSVTDYHPENPRSPDRRTLAADFLPISGVLRAAQGVHVASGKLAHDPISFGDEAHSPSPKIPAGRLRSAQEAWGHPPCSDGMVRQFLLRGVGRSNPRHRQRTIPPNQDHGPLLL